MSEDSMFNRIAVGALFLTFVAGAAAAAQTATRTPAQTVPNPTKSIPEIARAANGAIVTIIMANDDSPIAQGTGFLVRSDGVIVTNYHVIETGNIAVVKFPDGTVLSVDGVLAADKVRDLAIIRIHGKTFVTLTLGNSDQVQVGEEVVAIGNPLSFESTVSNGIISGRRTSEEQGGKFLQTTAPISPGSSGGPLFNMMGEVVGINTLYIEGGENLNFAIPVNDAKRLLLNQSSKLQNLPNETEPAKAQTQNAEVQGQASLSQQKGCSEQAEKFTHYEVADHTWGGLPPPGFEYTSHYDAKAGKCYVEFTLHFVEGKHPSDPRYGNFRMISDARFEGRGFPVYGSFGLPSTDIYGNKYVWDEPNCYIEPPDQQRIICRSEEEFNSLTLKYFGTTPH